MAARGCVRAYRAVADEIFVIATCGRHKYVPWGVGGGQDGSRNADEVADDVRDGYVTLEQAASDYGVTLDPLTLEGSRVRKGDAKW